MPPKGSAFRCQALENNAQVPRGPAALWQASSQWIGSHSLGLLVPVRSLRIVKLTHAAARADSQFPLVAEWRPLPRTGRSWFLHAPAGGRLGCFPALHGKYSCCERPRVSLCPAPHFRCPARHMPVVGHTFCEYCRPAWLSFYFHSGVF